MEEIMKEQERRKKTISIYKSTEKVFQLIGDRAQDTLSDTASSTTIQQIPTSIMPAAISTMSKMANQGGNKTSLNPSSSSFSSSVATTALYGSQSVSNGDMSGYLLKWNNWIEGYQRRWILLKDGLLSYNQYLYYLT